MELVVCLKNPNFEMQPSTFGGDGSNLKPLLFVSRLIIKEFGKKPPFSINL